MPNRGHSDAATSSALADFHWEPQPEAAEFVGHLAQSLVSRCDPVQKLADRMHAETGTRLFDFLDHIVMPDDGHLSHRLAGLGFESTSDGDWTVWHYPHGLLPEIHTAPAASARLAIKVESVTDFLLAQGLDDRTIIAGLPGSPLRKARLWRGADFEFWAVERHGTLAHAPIAAPARKIEAALRNFEAFRRRRRHFDDPRQGFTHAAELIDSSARDLGIDWTCDLFFAAEREFWQRRNRAAQIQKGRQDALGLGWANHDHHTYRSSRQHFAALIDVLELLGFVCRERFYGGRESGWGAQVLEQPNCQIVIFADVDMTPAEVSGDFAHAGLPPREYLGTVGLWCQLHGEAFLEAGMHHLECRFDFETARRQLAELGTESMRPFTDFAYLKQSFTAGEIWPVAPERIERTLKAGLITAEQAAQFRQFGALGSHLEILERDQAYKGFNQTGISEIIAETDPRNRRYE